MVLGSAKSWVVLYTLWKLFIGLGPPTSFILNKHELRLSSANKVKVIGIFLGVSLAAWLSRDPCEGGQLNGRT